MVQFESLGKVSYSSFTTTMAVSLTISEIVSIKQWRDLETGARGRSRSLKIAPFDGLYTTFYWSDIVSIAFLYHFRVILTLNNIMTLKSGLGITQDH